MNLKLSTIWDLKGQYVCVCQDSSKSLSTITLVAEMLVVKNAFYREEQKSCTNLDFDLMMLSD